MQIWERGSAGQPLPSTTGQHSPPSALLSKVEHYNPMRHTGRVLIADRTCCCFLVLAAHKQCNKCFLARGTSSTFVRPSVGTFFSRTCTRVLSHNTCHLLGTRHLQNPTKDSKFQSKLSKYGPLPDIRNVLDRLRCYLNHKLYNYMYKLWLVVVETFAWETLHVTERLPIWGLLIVSGPDRLQHDPTTVTPPHRRTTPLYQPFNAVNTQSLCYLTSHHRNLSENPDIMSQRGLLLKIPLITFATHFKRMHHQPPFH